MTVFLLVNKLVYSIVHSLAPGTGSKKSVAKVGVANTFCIAAPFGTEKKFIKKIYKF